MDGTEGWMDGMEEVRMDVLSSLQLTVSRIYHDVIQKQTLKLSCVYQTVRKGWWSLLQFFTEGLSSLFSQDCFKEDFLVLSKLVMNIKKGLFIILNVP